MTITEIDLRFTDHELQEALAAAAPGDGFTVTKCPPEINASEGASIIFRIIVKLSNPISIEADITVPAGIIFAAIATWSAAKLKHKVEHRESKKARVNNDVITLNKEDVLMVIHKEVRAQIARDRQWTEDHQRNDAKRQNNP